jgi:hypothetical protein
VILLLALDFKTKTGIFNQNVKAVDFGFHSTGLFMDFSSAIEFLQHFETARVIATLRELDLPTLLHNPWLLGGIGLLAVTALMLRWRLLLITLFTVAGLAGLITYTLEQEKTAGSLNPESLVSFVLIGALIVMTAGYFLFIKRD